MWRLALENEPLGVVLVIGILGLNETDAEGRPQPVAPNRATWNSGFKTQS
jgi:hypothetical protein